MLRADVRLAELARLLVRGNQRRLRIRRQRRRHARPLTALRVLCDLRCDRLRVGVDLLQHVAHHVVPERGVEQVVALEIETAPLERGLRRTAQQLARRVAEELRHVYALHLARRRGCALAAASGSGATEEVGEEVVEQAAPAEAAGHPLLGEVDLAQVLGLAGPVRQDPHPRRHRRTVMPLAKVLLGCHVGLLRIESHDTGARPRGTGRDGMSLATRSTGSSPGVYPPTRGATGTADTGSGGPVVRAYT